MIHTDHNDPAFRYEGLACAVFDNCEKYGDPFGIAAQDVFRSFVPTPTLEGKKALSKILSKMITDHSESEHKEELIALEETIWGLETQEGAIKVIDSAIEVLKRIKVPTES